MNSFFLVFPSHIPILQNHLGSLFADTKPAARNLGVIFDSGIFVLKTNYKGFSLSLISRNAFIAPLLDCCCCRLLNSGLSQETEQNNLMPSAGTNQQLLSQDHIGLFQPLFTGYQSISKLI